MTSVWLIAFGFLLLVAQSAFAMLVPIASFANLMLPIAIFLGVSPGVHIVRGALVAFALGYLVDSHCGNPIGLHTFVMTASFMVARGAGLRLFPQGTAFQVLLTFLMAIAFGATVLALRAIFEQPGAAIGESSPKETLIVLTEPALITALCSPFVFAVTRRLESLSASRQQERKMAG